MKGRMHEFQRIATIALVIIELALLPAILILQWIGLSGFALLVSLAFGLLVVNRWWHRRLAPDSGRLTSAVPDNSSGM